MQHELAILDLLQYWHNLAHGLVASFLEDEGFSRRETTLLSLFTLCYDLVELDPINHLLQLVEHDAVFVFVTVKDVLHLLALFNDGFWNDYRNLLLKLGLSFFDLLNSLKLINRLCILRAFRFNFDLIIIVTLHLFFVYVEESIVGFWHFVMTQFLLATDSSRSDTLRFLVCDFLTKVDPATVICFYILVFALLFFSSRSTQHLILSAFYE